MKKSSLLSAVGARLWQDAASLTAGGRWAAQLPDEVQRNLRCFFFDGWFSANSDALVLTFLTIYILALGATPAQIGLLSALGSIAATAVLVPGAILADRAPSRKWVAVLSGGVVTRLMWLAFALLPFLVPGTAAVTVAIALKVVADAAANLGFPAWTSLAADIVPLAWRGRYFGTRNIVMGISAMVITYLGGLMITQMGKPQGYQLAMGIGFLVGMGSTYSFSQIRETRRVVPAVASVTAYTPASLWQTLRTDRLFLSYFIFTAFWNFSLNVAGPFFTPYQVQTLGASAAMIGLYSIVTSLAGLPAQRLFGNLADHWGPRRVFVLTGLFIPVLPLAWAFSNAAWQGIPINIAGGVLWAGFSLASFNYLLVLAPAEQRARYSALLQIAVAASAAVGALAGGQIVSHWGYHVVFFCSFSGRLVTMLAFMWLVRKKMEVDPHRVPF